MDVKNTETIQTCVSSGFKSFCKSPSRLIPFMKGWFYRAEEGSNQSNGVGHQCGLLNISYLFSLKVHSDSGYRQTGSLVLQTTNLI